MSPVAYGLKPTAKSLPVAGQFGAWWRGLAMRERRLVGLTALLVGLALVWWIALAPAIATLRYARTQLPKLETGQLQMQALKAEAQALAGQPRLLPPEVRRLLETSISQTLGTTAHMQITTDRATIMLKNVTPEMLASWLVQVRANTRLVPLEVRLTRSTGGSAANSLGWDGSVTLQLPVTP